jgi:hypothetical protein
MTLLVMNSKFGANWMYLRGVIKISILLFGHPSGDGSSKILEPIFCNNDSPYEFHSSKVAP